jgi:hypothetical protein
MVTFLRESVPSIGKKLTHPIRVFFRAIQSELAINAPLNRRSLSPLVGPALQSQIVLMFQ